MWMFEGTLETTGTWLSPPLQVPSRGWSWVTWLPETPNWFHGASLDCWGPWCILATLCHTVYLFWLWRGGHQLKENMT